MEKHSGSACGAVVSHVMDMVAAKKYNAGDRLPPERELAALLEVSRPSVREAMKVLNYLGFISSNQGSGNYIDEQYSRTNANIMRVMMLRGDVSFDGFTAFRQMLELQAFELAADAVTGEQLAEMQKIVDLLDLTADDTLIFPLDNRFHTLLCESSGNPLIVTVFQALSEAISEYMFKTYNVTVKKRERGFEQLQIFHHRIADALRERDLPAGRQAIRDHFAWLK